MTYSISSLVNCGCFSSFQMYRIRGCLTIFCICSSKTEVMLFGSHHQLHNTVFIDFDGVALELQSKQKNLGVIFDATLCLLYRLWLRALVFMVFHLRNIACIWPIMLSFSVSKRLINSLIGVSKSSLNRLKYLQNSAASLLVSHQLF